MFMFLMLIFGIGEVASDLLGRPTGRFFYCLRFPIIQNTP